MAKNEIGFLKVIVQPLWEALNVFLKDKLAISVANLQTNLIKWGEMAEGDEKP